MISSLTDPVVRTARPLVTHSRKHLGPRRAHYSRRWHHAVLAWNNRDQRVKAAVGTAEATTCTHEAMDEAKETERETRETSMARKRSNRTGNKRPTAAAAPLRYAIREGRWVWDRFEAIEAAPVRLTRCLLSCVHIGLFLRFGDVLLVADSLVAEPIGNLTILENTIRRCQYS